MDSTLIEVLRLSWSREFCFSQVRDPLIQNLFPCCACSSSPCSPTVSDLHSPTVQLFLVCCSGSESRGYGYGHSPIVSCCAGYCKAAQKHAKSHSSSAWSCEEYFGCNFMTYFNHLKNAYFLSWWKKVHCFDVTGVWMINLGGEWEPGNLEFSSCLAASSVALGKS